MIQTEAKQSIKTSFAVQLSADQIENTGTRFTNLSNKLLLTKIIFKLGRPQPPFTIHFRLLVQFKTLKIIAVSGDRTRTFGAEGRNADH